MNKKKCLIYANCQGKGLCHFLNKSEIFKKEYESIHLPNYLMINQQQLPPLELLKKADLFIFQPLKEVHGIYSTKYIQELLPDYCINLSFPYIYNNGLWPLFKSNNEIVNSNPIIDLINQGLSTLEIMREFLALKIDFKFKERFEASLQRLKENEINTFVKASSYVEKNLSKEKLFLINNHPTSSLFFHCANQILLKLNYPLLVKEQIVHPNEAQLPGCFPHSPYEQNYFQFSYQNNWQIYHKNKKEGNWRHAYLKRIFDICLQKNHCQHPFETFCAKLYRSLSKYSLKNYFFLQLD